jgi:hypothetical protein
MTARDLADAAVSGAKPEQRGCVYSSPLPDTLAMSAKTEAKKAEPNNIDDLVDAVRAVVGRLTA